MGLVLSGGGARGLAHLGVIKLLEENNIRPDLISGTSAGALMGAFYAAGYGIEEIAAIIRKSSLFHLSSLAWSKAGLLKGNSNEKLLRSHLGKRRLEDLQIPLYISAVDIMKGEVVTLNQGDLVKALLASSAIPVLYEPVKVKNRLLIDGSALECFPTEPLLKKCDALLGVYVNPVKPTAKKLNMMEIFDRGYHLTVYHEVERKKQHCQVYLEPPELSRYGMFDLKKADEIIEIGYKAAKAAQSKILALGK